MSLITFIPTDALKPYVRLLAISEVTQEMEYKVLPGTSLVMGFQYRGHLSTIENTAIKPLETAGITGLQDKFRVFQNSKNIGTVLVFFNETGAACFFREPMNELFGESVSLENFVSKSSLNEIEESLSEAQTNQERITIIEQFLMARIQPIQADALVQSAIHQIQLAKGNIRITQLARQLYTSKSPLEKRFRRIVGASPKKFASIVRFNALLKDYDLEKTLTELGYEAGYFDQAHFIHDFKVFTGETPEEYFEKNALRNL
ncbi:response regulator transcription factor [Emticicia sp. BO119]|uniref:response regulator transcription factor n=1 Tax=Emticicia sp. BO119 TaxID=2757768 RepID=UPI0015F0C3EF|nr:response regulator transcription factor [Emticicia sp. BO119]MBA4851181.1 helix-turn-helix transcriptional regulator [Emticicia sp. BO119]